MVLLLLAAIGLGIALLPRLAGAADGIDAENIPLAATFLLDAGFTIGVVLLAVRRLAPPPAA